MSNQQSGPVVGQSHEVSDENLAKQLHEQELLSLNAGNIENTIGWPESHLSSHTPRELLYLNDRALALGLAGVGSEVDPTQNAIREDQIALDHVLALQFSGNGPQHMRSEHVAAQAIQVSSDYRLALSLAATDEQDVTQSTWQTHTRVQDEIDDDAVLVRADTRIEHAHPGQQHRDAIEEPGVQGVPATCASCGDILERHNSAVVPCQHAYCGDCLRQLFQMAISDET